MHLPNNAGPTDMTVTCPECRTPQQVPSDALSFHCEECGRTVRCAQCGVCNYCFAAVRARTVQCPRCLKAVRPRSAHYGAFGALETQRSTGVALPEEDTIAAIAPSLAATHTLRNRRVWAIAAALTVAIGLVGAALATHHKAHHSPPSVLPATGATTYSLAHCPVSSTLTLSQSQNAEGTYLVTVTGNATNADASSLANLEVSWVATYADLSTSVATTSLVNGGSLLTKGETATWSGTASTNDGTVPPTAVRVVHISYNHGAGDC